MAPRPAPDLDQRRSEVVRAARHLAESEGWPAVTVRRLAAELGVSQPVLYSAVPGRDAVVDAVALSGFRDLATTLHAVDAAPAARMRAYLAFAAAHPAVYTAMFAMPSGLAFASAHTPEPLARAFSGISDAFPDADDSWLELAWSTLHGLATLEANGRLTPGREEARFHLALRMLTGNGPTGPRPTTAPPTDQKAPES